MMRASHRQDGGVIARFAGVVTLVGGLCLGPGTWAEEPIHFQVDQQEAVDAYSSGTARDLASETMLYVLKGSRTSSSLSVEYVSLPRTLVLMNQRLAVCSPNKIRSAQRAHLLFSQPINLFLARRLYQDGGMPPIPDTLLTADGDVRQLAEVMNYFPQARLLLGHDISYGDQLDAEIADVPATSRLYVFGPEHLNSILGMFTRHRAHFILEYPVTMANEARSAEDGSWRSYGVAGVEPYMAGRLMCSDTPETRALIARVDAFLQDPVHRQHLLEVHLNHVPAEDHAMLRHYFEELGRTR